MFKKYILFLLMPAFFLMSLSAVWASTIFSTDFESGNLEGWGSSGGGASATISAEIKKSGLYSIKVSHDKTSSYGFQRTIQNIEGGMFYEVFGFGRAQDLNTSSVLIRVAWYSSADGSGPQWSSPNDTNSTSSVSDWSELRSGSIQAPGSVQSAKIRLVLNSKTSGQIAFAYFDDIIFQESIAPAPTPTDVPDPTKTPTPTKTSTPTQIPSLTPTKKPSLTPTGKITSSPTESNLPSLIDEEKSSSEENLPTPEVLGETTSKSPIFFIVLGLIFLSVCAILAYFQFGNKMFESLRRV